MQIFKYITVQYLKNSERKKGTLSHLVFWGVIVLVKIVFTHVIFVQFKEHIVQ